MADMFLWRRYSIVLLLSRKGEEDVVPLKGSFVEGRRSGLHRSKGSTFNKSKNLKALTTFWNPYRLHVFHKFLDYSQNEREDESIKATILSVA